MASSATFALRRHLDAPHEWWVYARIEWGQGSGAAGLARSVPFRTRKAAYAWVVEQFPGAENQSPISVAGHPTFW